MTPTEDKTTPDSPLTGKMVPRRGAAKRASIAIVKDAEDNMSSEEEITKDGPTRVAASKTKESKNGRDTGPSKALGDDPLERKRPSPIKTYSAKRKRRAAAVLEAGDSSSDEMIPWSSSKTPVAVSSPVSPKSPIKTIAGNKAKPVLPKLHVSGLDGEDSDLTPLSSPIESQGKSEDEANSASPTETRMPTREHPMFITRHLTNGFSSNIVRGHSSWEAGDEAGWSFEGLGQFVWVHLDGKNGKSANVYNTHSKVKESLWWPAMVKNGSKTPLKTKLFGDHPRPITIDIPSWDNVRPRLNNLSMRFDSYEAALQNSATADDSRRKRVKSEDESKSAWERATQQMLEKAEEVSVEMDDLPHPMEVLSAGNMLRRTASSSMLKLNGNGKASGVSRKGKRKYSEEVEDESIEEEPSEYPPDEDGHLDIPGELLFSRSTPSETVYWPAKLIAYVPPKKKGKLGKYTVQFLDLLRKDVPRSYFFTQDDPGYHTCKIGQYASALDEEKDDEEDDEEEGRNRSPSPERRDPPPRREKYILLSLREQFVYVKPILKAILNNEYEPTRAKVQIFMSGTKKQQAMLSQVSSGRGMMDARQVKELLLHLKHWCLRGERSVGLPHREEDVVDPESEVPVFFEGSELSDSRDPPSPMPSEPVSASSPPVEPPSSSFSPLTEVSSTQESLVDGEGETERRPEDMETLVEGASAGVAHVSPRQTGTPEYEALSPFQRFDFCLNVLLPEAIRQILLWRNGYRSSVDLLPTDEEQKLYMEGQKLLEERDWVKDVIRWRQEYAKGKNGAEPPKPKNETNSRSGRRILKISYAE